MTKLNYRQRPNVIPWPPIFLVLSGVTGATLTYYWPVPIAPEPWASLLAWFGYLIGFAAIVLYIWSERVMHGARTNVLPHKPARTLVRHGPFRISRNPIYLANTLLLLSGAFIFHSPWLAAIAVVNGVLLHHFAILREEAHLKANFEGVWEAYAKVTPRWIGPL